MVIRSATALRNDYDGMVKLSQERQEPIFVTRNGDGEMVFLPIELWETCWLKCCEGSKTSLPGPRPLPWEK